MTGRFPAIFVVVILCAGTRVAGQNQNPRRPPAPSQPSATAIGKLKVTTQAGGLTIEINVSNAVIPKTIRLDKPDRLVFDFLGCELEGRNRMIPVNSGPVQELRLSQFQAHPPITRLVVDSTSPLDFQVKSAETRVVIEVTLPIAASVTAASVLQSIPVETENQAQKSEPRKPPEQPIPSSSQNSRPTAYSLQAKARTLTLSDLQTLEDKAATGDPEAETTLALAYHTAILLKRNDAEALRLLHQAASQEFMAAQESLGIFSQMGIGLEHPDPVAALDWYKKAVQQGSPDAATNIGLMFAEGIGVPKDPAQALPWFRQAAEKGDPSAQYNLALIYARGNGVPQDYKESVRWLTAAAEQNVLPALLDLALYYMAPPDSTAADKGRAISYYEKAADLGSAQAQATLGRIFARGLDGKPDYAQSVKWFRQAAEQGNPDGQLGLGLRYAQGQGVPPDLEAARRLFTAAANQGQMDAEYNLATMYEDGKGAPQDLSQAEHYYQLAADQGMPKAQFRLGRWLASNRESRSNRVSAYKWLMLADSIQESGSILSQLRKAMDAQEVAEAEREVDKWRVTHLGQPHRN